MRYQALKKKTFLAAATFTGIAVLFPVLCMAASENDVQTYTIQILQWILWYQKHSIPQVTI